MNLTVVATACVRNNVIIVIDGMIISNHCTTVVNDYFVHVHKYATLRKSGHIAEHFFFRPV